MFHRDRDRQRFAVAGQADHLGIEYPTALQRHQGLHRGGEGAGNQDLGRIAQFVELFVGDQVDAVVVCARPGDKAVTADPDKNEAADRVAGITLATGNDLILAAPFGCPGKGAHAVAVGSHRGGEHWRALDAGLPGKVTVGTLFVNAVPVEFVNCDP